jgi:hypothetical protein
VVTRATPFHWTTEQGRKLLPVTLRGKDAPPAVALPGAKVVIAGTGSDEAETVKGEAAETTPELDTVTDAAPAAAISAAEIPAVSCVALTNAVARGELFQETTEPFTKFAPFTVSVKPAAVQDGVAFDCVVDDDNDVIEGGITANGMAADVPPPGVGVNITT